MLGKGKADIFKQGKLMQGMIRAPLAKVREKIGSMDTRDELTQKYFNGRDIAINGRLSPRKLGNVDLVREDIPLLLGVPDGAKMHVKQAASRIEMDATHPFFSSPQAAFITRDGVLHWDSLFLKEDAPAGMGTRIAGIMVETASAMGLREIQMKAWGPPYNGHYTWARMGWDGGFSADEESRLAKAGFGGVHTVSQIMASEAGRAWWKSNGWDVELSFDLDGEGRAMRVLKRYLALKGVRS